MTGERNMNDVRDDLLNLIKDKKYDLIYVDYRDELGAEQVQALATGDMEKFWDYNIEWESDARWSGAQYVYDDLLDSYEWEDEDERIEFDSSSFRDEIFEAIMDRDESDPYKQLAGNTSAVLMRVSITDEDSAWQMGAEPPTAADAVATVGLPVTPHNIEVMESILAEENPYYSGATASLIFAADPGWLYDLPYQEDTLIEVINPYIWIGNPWQGDGWVNEKPFEGSIFVKRGDLNTDKGAWGYGWQATSDCYVSGYEVELKVHEPAKAS